MVRTWQLLVCWVLLVGSAAADNWIYAYTKDGAFDIVQLTKTVTIPAPGSYILWATDDADPDGLGQTKIRVLGGGEHPHRSYSDARGKLSRASECPLCSRANPAADSVATDDLEG